MLPHDSTHAHISQIPFPRLIGSPHNLTPVNQTPRGPDSGFALFPPLSTKTWGLPLFSAPEADVLQLAD